MELLEFRSMLEKSFAQNNLTAPDEEQTKEFWIFTEYLLKINAHTNLTAIRTLPEMISKHYADSLLVAELIPHNARVLDVGCGAGFPSVPLAIMRKDLQITALDSTEKKLRFVAEGAKKAGISLQTCVGRAEDAKIRASLGQFDVVVSRAVARMSILSELCLPYVKIGGKLVALKASKAEEELAEAKRGVGILGGSDGIIYNRTLHLLSGESEPRALIEVSKVKETPSAYPRPYASIQKKPL